MVKSVERGPPASGELINETISLIGVQESSAHSEVASLLSGRLLTQMQASASDSNGRVVCG